MQIKTVVRAVCMMAAAAAVTTTTGCASIVSGTNQVMSVETLSKTGKVEGASCKLQNDKGVYYVTTPGTVNVHRAYGDLSVTCEKAGMPTGLATIKSSTKGMMAGNILFGGIIGAGVDAASGAAYDYPVLLQIMMGDTVPNPLLPAPVAGAPAATGGMK